MSNEHKKLIAKHNTARPENKNTTPALELFHDFMDSVRPVPPIIDEQHYMRLKRVAAFLGIADDDDQEEICTPESVAPVKPFVYHFPKIFRKTLDLNYRIKKILDAFPAVGKLKTPSNTTNNDNNLVQEAVNAVPKASTLDKSFVPKSYATILAEMQPYVAATGLSTGAAAEAAGAIRDSQIAQFYRQQEEEQKTNEGTKYPPPATDEQTAKDTMGAVKTTADSLSELFNDVDASGTSTAHLVSSDVAADTPKHMLSIRANQEFIRRKKLDEAKATDNFILGKPSIIFISDFFFAGENKGNVIAWRKVPQSAGYILKRVNVVTGKEVSFTVFNEELADRFEHISQFVRTLSSFHDIAFGNVMAFLDETVTADSLYLYKITAFQTFVSGRTSVFITPLAPSINLSSQQKKMISVSISLGTDSIYPALAEKLLGDRKLDWVLAGINVRASVSRRDDRSISRKYSYLDAKPEFLFSQMESGKLLLPYDTNVVVKAISSNISSFGVVNALYDIFRETGILYTFEGVDPAEDGEFIKPSVSADETKFLGIVSSAIDADTMLVNLRTLVTNLTKFLGGGISNQKDSTGLAVSSKANVKIIDIDVSNSISIDNIERNKLNSELGNLDDIVDLHTFEGISRLIRTIRIVSDLGPVRT